MYYYGARYYDPRLARFVSADTIVPKPFYPQSLNRFAYAYNNPIRLIDLDGHEATAGEDEGGFAGVEDDEEENKETTDNGQKKSSDSKGAVDSAKEKMEKLREIRDDMSKVPYVKTNIKLGLELRVKGIKGSKAVVGITKGIVPYAYEKGKHTGYYEKSIGGYVEIGKYKGGMYEVRQTPTNPSTGRPVEGKEVVSESYGFDVLSVSKNQIGVGWTFFIGGAEVGIDIDEFNNVVDKWVNND